jgi:DNA repair protein RadA/Sms
MVLAVLEARCGLAFAAQDVYLNVAGGLRITEPAADLAVAAALVSSRLDAPVPPDTVVFGEIGLAGEVRAVSQTETRLKEAAKLGFARALTPPAKEGTPRRAGQPEIREIGHLIDLVEVLSGGGNVRAGKFSASKAGDRPH